MLKSLVVYLFTFLAITTLCITNSYAQYNGECWAADYTNVIKISGNKATKIAGFSQPLSVAVNSKDGICWVADTDAVSVKKLSSSGKLITKLEGIFDAQPLSIAVDPNDGSCWVATINAVYKFSSEAKQLFKREGYNEPVLIVNPKNGDCWIADSNNARIVRLSSDGKQLSVIQPDGINQPKSISINPEDGTCWVLDSFAQKVVKLSPDGTVLAQASVSTGTSIMATTITATNNGECWIAVMVDTMNDVVLKLSSNGKQILSVSGFSMPNGLAFDPKDNGCWVADTNHGQIVKLSSSGQKIVTIKGFDQPKAVTVGYPIKN
ncbi:MAG: NHL repeat-containing protein [bacterium]